MLPVISQFVYRPESMFAAPGGRGAICFTTLDAICRALCCQPGDLLEYEAEVGEVEPANE